MRALTGVLAAVPTPLDAALAPDQAAVAAVLDNAARQGCHGALVLGTTGEGPSFSLEERRSVIDAAAAWRRDRPDFLLLAGTGCVSITDTIHATRHAFAAGCDAVVMLPPYYWKAASADGLAQYFRRVLDGSLRGGERGLLYHFPLVSGVAVPGELVASLAESHPGAFAGLKDSGGDLAHTLDLIGRFPQLAIFTGTDSHAVACVGAGGAGAITALANIMGATLAAAVGGDMVAAARMAEARATFERWPSVPAIKALLAGTGVPVGAPRLPLVALGQELAAQFRADLGLD